MWDFLYDLRGHAAHHGVRGHIPRHHRPGGHHRAVADSDAPGDDRAGADPHAVSDANRRAAVGAVIGIEVVVDGGQHHPMPDQRVIPDVDAALILKTAAGVDEHMLSQVDIPAEIGIEGREQHQAFVHLFTRQIRHDRHDFLRRMIRCVQRHRLANGVLALLQGAGVHFRRHVRHPVRIQIFQNLFDLLFMRNF